MNRAIWECPQDPSIVFRGCPETTQLAWRTADALGFGIDAVVMQGKGKDAEDDRWVDHIWVEIPSLRLRIETNASQILGRPQFVEVLDLSDFEERYRDGFEHMEFLERVTEEGEDFYWNLAKGVARCVQRRLHKG
jgi:hypothetical protein